MGCRTEGDRELAPADGAHGTAIAAHLDPRPPRPILAREAVRCREISAQVASVPGIDPGPQAEAVDTLVVHELEGRPAEPLAGPSAALARLALCLDGGCAATIEAVGERTESDRVELDRRGKKQRVERTAAPLQDRAHIERIDGD